MTTVYEIDWGGWISNIFAAVCSAAMILGIFFALRTILRAIAIFLTVPSQRSIWYWAGFIFFFWLCVIFMAAKGIASARSGGSTSFDSGVVGGVARSVKQKSSRWLAVSILAGPVLTWGFISMVFKEPPLKLSVSSNEIRTLYRLPWRDESIRMTDVKNLCLERHNYQARFGQDFFYVLTIDHNGVTTSIQCNHRKWYESQLVAAYQAIQTHLAEQVHQFQENRS